VTTAYARSRYEETQVQTTPGRLVVMLYDGALRFELSAAPPALPPAITPAPDRQDLED